MTSCYLCGRAMRHAPADSDISVETRNICERARCKAERELHHRTMVDVAWLYQHVGHAMKEAER